MAYGLGLGKQRSKLGAYLDRYGISQGDLAKAIGRNKDTISALCDGRKEVRANVETQIKIVGALRRMGYDISREDFWP